MKFNPTDCCALAHLCDINNDTGLDLLKAVLLYRKQKMLENKEVGVSTGEGQAAIFSIISPGEDRLEKKLKLLGFKEVTTFDRRKGYPKGRLKMYLIELKNVQDG